MTEAYFTEDAKMVKLERKAWDFHESLLIVSILYKKGYSANSVSRIGADQEWHDALQVQRSDVPRLVEQFFRQRIVAEYQAEGKGKAAIIFSHNYRAETIIAAVKRFQKNK